MKRVFQRLLAAGAAALCLAASIAHAADGPSVEPSAAASVATPELAATAANAGLQRDAICTKCHDESETKPILSIYQTRHGVRADARTPSCQNCHGSSASHVAGGKGVGDASRPSPDIVFKTRTTLNAPASAQAQADSCIACHKGGKRTHWDGSQHQSRDVPCAGCHQVHVKADPVLSKRSQPEVCFSCHKTERAQTHRQSTHPIDAGKMACSDCHNPHGSAGPKLLAKASVNETCYTCHTEKRGPFLWEHSPVADDCTNCHSPHGANNNNLLKARLPFLCQECHQDHGSSLKSGASIANGPGNPAAGVNAANAYGNKFLTVQGNGRDCLNCHVMVHGSNHPAGGKFNR
ncbi:MAG: DmsE family decaheme c-type cytochrome [Leptothrix sp. (in: b-proteobacteria)]